ncbi:MAG: hydro-lyase, Fe-S type, tartrate/fumarate subfamily, alpha subunit [Planctomycetota bacterium]
MSCNWENAVLELIRRTSSSLPEDVVQVLELNRSLEQSGSNAELALELVSKNIQMAKNRSMPICQDTGTISFYISTPIGFDQLVLEKACVNAVSKATEIGFLRQNSVDSVDGKNSGNNLGPGSPTFHFHQHSESHVDLRLILKGGGCENMSAQYSLPTMIQGKRCDRDLDGVRAVVLDAIFQAQGKGCGPGFIGVCIGGDRASGYDYAKQQLLRTLDDVNPDPKLAELEALIMSDANKLEIGPMGFGGKFTIGGCKVGKLNRLPASFFVSVSYMCWAYRRRGVLLDLQGNAKEWLYQNPDEKFPALNESNISKDQAITIGLAQKPNARKLQLPLDENIVRSLKSGDIVLLNGKMFTGRDEIHKYLFKGGDIPQIRGGVIYHCGPVVLEKNGLYKIIAAGPTTSIREEPYQADVIEKFGIKAVVGKGGMGQKTLDACKKFGCVYLHAIGGAAQIYAACVTNVPAVYLKEKFGSPEAVWEMEVRDFPAVVTMDSHGNSLHQNVNDDSKTRIVSMMK